MLMSHLLKGSVKSSVYDFSILIFLEGEYIEACDSRGHD